MQIAGPLKAGLIKFKTTSIQDLANSRGSIILTNLRLGS